MNPTHEDSDSSEESSSRVVEDDSSDVDLSVEEDISDDSSLFDSDESSPFSISDGTSSSSAPDGFLCFLFLIVFKLIKVLVLSSVVVVWILELIYQPPMKVWNDIGGKSNLVRIACEREPPLKIVNFVNFEVKMVWNASKWVKPIFWVPLMNFWVPFQNLPNFENFILNIPSSFFAVETLNVAKNGNLRQLPIFSASMLWN